MTIYNIFIKKLVILNNSNFKVKHFDVIYLIVILCILIGIVYLMIKKLKFKISKRLSIIHVSLTFLGALVILFPILFIKIFDLNNKINLIIEIGIYITIFGQLFFLTNIFQGYRTSKKIS